MYASRTLGRIQLTEKETQTESDESKIDGDGLKHANKKIKTFKFSYGTANVMSNYTVNVAFTCKQLQCGSVKKTKNETEDLKLLDLSKTPPLLSGNDASLNIQECGDISIVSSPNNTMKDAVAVIELIDSSREENYSEGHTQQEEEVEDWSRCGICLDVEPDAFLKCLHAFCVRCLQTMRDLKTKIRCPKCKKGFRKWYSFDDGSTAVGLPRNFCRHCKVRKVDALLGCLHLFCSVCLERIKHNSLKPICPRAGCNVGFRKFKYIHF